MSLLITGQLHGKAADPTGCAMNQHPLSLRELGPIDECLPCSKGRDRYRCGQRIDQRSGLRRKVARNSQTIFRLSTIAEPIAQSIYRISDPYSVGIRSDRGDHTGEFVTENEGERSCATVKGVKSGIPCKLRRCDRGGRDLDKYLIVIRTGFRRLLIAKRFRPTNVMQSYRSH